MTTKQKVVAIVLSTITLIATIIGVYEFTKFIKSKFGKIDTNISNVLDEDEDKDEDEDEDKDEDEDEDEDKDEDEDEDEDEDKDED